MLCTKYNIGNKLPKYLEKDGFMIPCVPANFEKLGVLVRVGATPDDGKTITKSHGELIDGQWVEVIDEQLTAEEINQASIQEQVANLNKCSKLEIRRAMRTLGVEANLDSLLTNEQFAKDWNDAIEIELSDELTLQAITAYNIDVNSVKEQIIINRSL
jgi:hypothetical protein